MSQLVDALFPSTQSWANGLREAALLAGADVLTAAKLLDHLRTRITQPEMPEEGKFVRVMSLHKSKGLTSRAVVVCGCIEGLVPFRGDEASPHLQENVLREQRRLFYVATTRCTEFLLLSSFLTLPGKVAYKIGAKVTGKWFTKRTIASQFLSELGPAAPKPVRGDSLKL